MLLMVMEPELKSGVVGVEAFASTSVSKQETGMKD